MIEDRIGTVHTFQGKEAEAVIFVLGAPGNDSTRARDWAGKKVNLLNVAITRAKRRLYVIGNYDAWKEAGFFSELANSFTSWLAGLGRLESYRNKSAISRLVSK